MCRTALGFLGKDIFEPVIVHAVHFQGRGDLADTNQEVRGKRFRLDVPIGFSGEEVEE